MTYILPWRLFLRGSGFVSEIENAVWSLLLPNSTDRMILWCGLSRHFLKSSRACAISLSSPNLHCAPGTKPAHPLAPKSVSDRGLRDLRRTHPRLPRNNRSIPALRTAPLSTLAPLRPCREGQGSVSHRPSRDSAPIPRPRRGWSIDRGTNHVVL